MTAPNAAVVGVDGGNSKTDIVLADTSGRILSLVRCAGTRPHIDGMDATLVRVADGISQARAQAGVGEGPLAAAAFHLANLDTEESESEARQILNRFSIAGRLEVGNDTLAVLKAGASAGWGVAVVSGAGVNAIGCRPDGTTERFLALGETTGDWGGGHSLGMAALGAAVRAGDGRGPQTVLRAQVCEVLGVPSPEEAALRILDGRMDVRAVLDLAPAVGAAAQAGDPAARAIVEKQAAEIVAMITALITRLGLSDPEIPVILGGGTLQHGPQILHDRINDALGTLTPQARILRLRLQPVVGSVAAALELAGASPQAKEMLRNSPEMAA